MGPATRVQYGYTQYGLNQFSKTICKKCGSSENGNINYHRALGVNMRLNLNCLE